MLIGDFGLSSIRNVEQIQSVLGTPEFMAPELYNESYDEKVDIYAFGMCILEMCSKEYPYEECSNAAQIWKKVSLGIMPDVLHRIREPTVRAFIECCLTSSENRLSAADLLKHPFLKYKRSDPMRDNIIVSVDPRPEKDSTHNNHTVTQRTGSISPSHKLKINDKMLYGDGNPNTQQSTVLQQQSINVNKNIINNTTNSQPAPKTSSIQHRTVNTNTDQNNHNTSHNTIMSPASTPHTITNNRTLPSQPSLRNIHVNQSTNSPLAANNSAISSPINISAHTTVPPTASQPTYDHVVDACVDIDKIQGNQCDVQLHIYFEPQQANNDPAIKPIRKKKAIRFVFDFLSDTCDGVAIEMIKALKLPDIDRTQLFLTNTIYDKVEPHRQLYFKQHPEQLQHKSTSDMNINMNTQQHIFNSMISPPVTVRHQDSVHHQMNFNNSTISQPEPVHVSSNTQSLNASPTKTQQSHTPSQTHHSTTVPQGLPP